MLSGEIIWSWRVTPSIPDRRHRGHLPRGRTSQELALWQRFGRLEVFPSGEYPDEVYRGEGGNAWRYRINLLKTMRARRSQRIAVEEPGEATTSVPVAVRPFVSGWYMSSACTGG